MAIQTVNTGTTPNDGTGDPARTAFTKLNDNFTATENAASKLVATNAQALAGTANVLPDAAGVHSAIRGLAVGTVSQSGGVPTGAIIQRGSNVNGEFVRYADGTQICTREAFIDLTNTSSIQTFNFPAAFTSSNHPIVTNICDFDGFLPSTSLQGNGGVVATITITPNRNSNSRWLVSVNQSGGVITNRRMYLSAIGRWY